MKPIQSARPVPFDRMLLLDPGRSHRLSAIGVFHGKIGFAGHSEWGAAMLIHLHKQAIVRHWSDDNGGGHDHAEGAVCDPGQ